MKGKGYVLSFEAIVSLALLAILVSMPLYENQQSLGNLQIFKKENDLLLIWAKDIENLNEERAVLDFEEAFPGKNGEIFFNGKKLAVGKKGLEAVSSNAVFFDKNLERKELGILVYK